MENLFIFLFALLLFCFMLLKLSKKYSALKLPPGPRPLPIIGNLHQIGGGLMHHILREMARTYGPLFRIKFGQVSTIVVSSPEIAKEIFRTHDVVFSYRPQNIAVFNVMTYNFSNIAFAPYGNYWRQMRKICVMEILGASRVRSFGSIRQEEVMNLIRFVGSHKGKLVNVSEKIYGLTYSITARAAFGKVSKYQQVFKEHMDKYDDLARGLDIADFYPSMKFLRLVTGMERKLKVMFKEVDEILQVIIDEHRDQRMKKIRSKVDDNEKEEEEGNEDIVDVLMNLQQSGQTELPVTDDNIKAVILDIFGAGGDTTAATLEWALAESLKNKQVLKRAQEELRTIFHSKRNVDESGFNQLKYLPAIVKETLRLHPPAPLSLPRECSEECNIYGYDIPAKTRVMVNIWAMGRDPKYWSEPEEFKPERFIDSRIDYKGNDFEYIPFGAGRRICPGMSFAIPNVALPLAQLLFHFDWKVDDDAGKLEDLDMVEHPVLEARRKNELKLIPVIYEGSCLKN